MAMLESVQVVSSQYVGPVFRRANKPLIFHSNWLIVCPRSNLLRDSNIILINLLDSLAICTFVGHRSLTNFSSFVRSLKSDSIDDIFPKRQFLSISNIGQSSKKWNSLSGCAVAEVLRGAVHHGGVHVGGGWVVSGLQ